MKKLILSIITATILWFFMFSPWTKGCVNFWYSMTAAAFILICISWRSTLTSQKKLTDQYSPLKTMMLGVVIAVVMWGVFFIGDKLSQLLFDFARPEVNNIYAMKGDISLTYIALALLLLIGPAEEIFWRGYIQEKLQSRLGDNVGFIVATLIYTLIHIWSFNFMLIMAALVCGVVWGFIYRLDKRTLPALILSHALWDCAAFAVFPF